MPLTIYYYQEQPALNKPRYKTAGDYTQYQPIGRVTEAALEGLGWTRELFGSLSSLDLAGQRWYAWPEGRVVWFAKRTTDGKLEPSRTFTLEDFSTTFPT